MTPPATRDCADPTPNAPRVGRALRIALAILFAVALAIATVEASGAVGSDPNRPDIVDFHPFYLAGRSVWDGHFADCYSLPLMRAAQRAFGGDRDVFMPFVYPPLFGLVMAPFALLPVGPAFLLFTLSTFAFYLAVLRRLAGGWFWPVVLTMSPVLLIDIRMGQNGFLTAGLAGLSAALALNRRAGLAGLTAGALAFKPQLAAMLPVLFALRRDGRALASAAATAAALTGLAVLALGRDTLPGFLSGTSVAAALMAQGAIPLHRMTSLYAFAQSLGAPPRAALALHGAAAVCVGAATAATAWRLAASRDGAGAADPRSAAGLTLMATAFVSPYLFDYDLAVLGPGLALLLPRLAGVMTPRRLTLLLAAIGLVGVLDLVATVLVSLGYTASLSFGGPALLACHGAVLATLRRSAVEDRADAPRPGRPAVG